MKKNAVKSEVKVNRYTILADEIKRVSKELKVKKQEMLKTINDAIIAYRKYRKEVYMPARKAAFDVYKASKVYGLKKTNEKKTVKKLEVKKNVKTTSKKVASKKVVKKIEAVNADVKVPETQTSIAA